MAAVLPFLGHHTRFLATDSTTAGMISNLLMQILTHDAFSQVVNDVLNEPKLLLALGLGPMIGIISVLFASYFSNKKAVDLSNLKYKLTKADIEKTARKIR